MAWARFLFRPAPFCSYCCYIAATPSLFKKLFGKVQGADFRGPEIGLLCCDVQLAAVFAG